MKKPKFFIYVVKQYARGLNNDLEKEMAFKSIDDAKEELAKRVEHLLSDPLYGSFDEECRFFESETNTFVQNDDGSVWWQVYIRKLAVR